MIAILVAAQNILAVASPINAQETGDKKTNNCSYIELVVHDGKGIPYYNYSNIKGINIGLQRNPVTVTQEALRFYEKYESNPKNESAKDFFINNVDWLVSNAVEKQYNGSFPYKVLEYYFPLPVYNLEPPWRSSMAQGRALDVLAKAHKLTGNTSYLDTAKTLLNSFFIEVSDGGVTYKTNDSGWWYELFASKQAGRNEPRVLNGMIFTVLGLFEYYNYTNDSNAKFLFDQGIIALKNDLAKYDHKGIASYDANGTLANADYQSIHIMQLGYLYNLTHEHIFKQFRDKWGETFVLTELMGKEIESDYRNTCSDKMFEIRVRGDSHSHVLELLNASTYTWKPVNYAKVSQSNDNLDITVETDNPDKIYNRAYLQTQLNFTQNQPLVLLLDYAAETFEGNATFGIEIRNIESDRILWSDILEKGFGEVISKKFLLPTNVSNMPVEFRFYVVTENIGIHTLVIDRVALLSNIHIDIDPNLNL
jgi:heparosan-N-sulfate-glucuronate 5-epimerase